MYHDTELADHLEFGFPANYVANGPPSPTFTNHREVPAHGHHIQAYIEEELRHGVLLGPFKVFGQGSGADCRRHVQKLNLLRGDAGDLPIQRDDAQSLDHTFSTTSQSLTGTKEKLSSGGGAEVSSSSSSRWQQFLTLEQKEDAKQAGDDLCPSQDSFTTDRQQFDASNANYHKQRRQRVKCRHDDSQSVTWQKRQREDQPFDGSYSTFNREDAAEGAELSSTITGYAKRRETVLEQGVTPPVSMGCRRQQQQWSNVEVQMDRTDKPQGGVSWHSDVNSREKENTAGSSCQTRRSYDSMWVDLLDGDLLANQAPPVSRTVPESLTAPNKTQSRLQPPATSKWATFMDVVTVQESSSEDENCELFVNFQPSSKKPAANYVETIVGRSVCDWDMSQGGEREIQSAVMVDIDSKACLVQTADTSGSRGSSANSSTYGGHSLFSTEDNLDDIIDEV